MNGSKVAIEYSHEAKTADVTINSSERAGDKLTSEAVSTYDNSELHVATVELVGDTRTAFNNETGLTGTTLLLSERAKIQLDKGKMHYEVGKLSGELKAKDSTVSFDECRETKTAQVNLDNTKRYGRTLRSQATASYVNNSELSVHAVKLREI